MNKLRTQGMAKTLLTASDHQGAVGASSVGDSSSFETDYDVVVIGAGPQGILYASWLKLARPQTRVVVLEREETPKHKIGESTLSGFCKALRSVGIRQDGLRQLFFPKNGLGFFHIDESTRDLTQASEYILETFDETFQVERRILDSLLIANARRLGVKVIQGAQVNISHSTLTQQGNIITYSQGQQEFQLRASLLVDASGPASVLARHLDLYTKENATFQSSAVWGYFKNVRRFDSRTDWKQQAQFSRDHYTQHLCFSEGWMWYIPLNSWQAAPDANVNQLLERMLEPTGEFPMQEQLAETYGSPVTDIVSIGLVLRRDRDRALKQGPQAAFDHYVNKYPAIRQVLDGAELLDKHYGNRQPLQTRANVRGHARQVTGDGWMIIGDAAFFVDPLISPGLTGGVATAYFAAQTTLKVLDTGNFSCKAFTNYDRFVHRLHEALERDNQLVYMSFNHPEALELIQRFQEIDARRHFNQQQRTHNYSLADTNVWGILSPTYQIVQKQVWSILREAELKIDPKHPSGAQSSSEYTNMVERLKDCLLPYLEMHAELSPYMIQNSQPEPSTEEAHCFSTSMGSRY